MRGFLISMLLIFCGGGIYADEFALLPAIAFVDQNIEKIPIWAIDKKPCDINFMIRGGVAPYKVTWNFGDGSATCTKDCTDRRIISAQHTYQLSMYELRGHYRTSVTAVDCSGKGVTITREITVINQQEYEKDINLQRLLIISKAMWYLHCRFDGVGNFQGEYNVSAECGAYLQLLCNCNHNPFGNNYLDGYLDDSKALYKKLLNSLEHYSCDMNFDCNNNGKTLYSTSANFMYANSIVSMALTSVLSNMPANAITNISFKGQQVEFYTICQDMAETLLFSQNPGAGWRYTPRSGDSDYSVTQWPVIALQAWEKTQANLPGGIDQRMQEKIRQAKSWLSGYLAGSVKGGGIGYMAGSDPTVTLTGSGVCCAAWVKADYDGGMMKGFRDYIFNGLRNLHTDVYCAYAIMKGFRNYEEQQNIERGRFRNSAGTIKEWYDELTSGLVQLQHANGSFPDYYGSLGTSLMTLCILPRVYEATPIPIIEIVGQDNIPLTSIFDHSRSLSGDDQLKINEYRWNFGDGDSYTTKEQFERIEHTYKQAGTYEINLTAVLIRKDKNNKRLEATIRRKITVVQTPKTDGRFIPPRMFIVGPLMQKCSNQMPIIGLGREMYAQRAWSDNILITLKEISSKKTMQEYDVGKAQYVALAIPGPLADEEYSVNFSTKNHTIESCSLRFFNIERSGDFPRRFDFKPSMQLDHVPTLPEGQYILEGIICMVLENSDAEMIFDIDFRGIGGKMFGLAKQSFDMPHNKVHLAKENTVAIKRAKLLLFFPKLIPGTEHIRNTSQMPIGIENGTRDTLRRLAINFALRELRQGTTGAPVIEK